MNNQQPQQHGRGTSWLISFGDLLTLLVCFFLSILSFSNSNKQANALKAPKVLNSEVVLQNQRGPIPNVNPPGTQIADKKVDQVIGSDLSKPLRIDFEVAEFEGSGRRLSMKARQRLKTLVTLDGYEKGGVVIGSCYAATQGEETQITWENAKLQALELKRQLIDAGWKGVSQDVRLQVLGRHCGDMKGQVAFIKVTAERVSNG